MRLPHLLSFELAPLVFPYSISHSGMVCFIAHKRVQVMKLSLGQMLQGDSDKLSYFVEQEIWIRHCANLKTFSTFHRHTPTSCCQEHLTENRDQFTLPDFAGPLSPSCHACDLPSVCLLLPLYLKCWTRGRMWNMFSSWGPMPSISCLYLYLLNFLLKETRCLIPLPPLTLFFQKALQALVLLTVYFKKLYLPPTLHGTFFNSVKLFPQTGKDSSSSSSDPMGSHFLSH